MILGAILNLVTGLIVDKFPEIYIVLVSAALAAVAPLLPPPACQPVLTKPYTISNTKILELILEKPPNHPTKREPEKLNPRQKRQITEITFLTLFSQSTYLASPSLTFPSC